MITAFVAVLASTLATWFLAKKVTLATIAKRESERLAQLEKERIAAIPFSVQVVADRTLHFIQVRKAATEEWVRFERPVAWYHEPSCYFNRGQEEALKIAETFTSWDVFQKAQGVSEVPPITVYPKPDEAAK